MILTCRNGYINLLQIALSSIQDKYYNALRGMLKSTKCLYTKVNILTKYINVLKDYEVFEQEVKQAVKFTFNASTDFETITVTSTGGTWTFTATSLNPTNVASRFATFLQEETDLYSLYGTEVVLSGNVVYLYHYAVETLTFSGNVTTDIEDITQDYTEILNNMNCLTFDQVCKMINHGFKISNTTC